MEFLLNLLKVSAIAGAVTALLGLLGPALRRRYHAKWRYWVWLCLAVLLLSPLVPLPKLERETIYHAPVQVEVPAMEVTYDREEGLSLTPQTTLVLPSTPAADSAPASEAGETVPAVTVPESSPKPAETAQKIPVETVLLILWAVGAAASALWVLGETVFFSRQCMRWARRPNQETAAVLAAEKEALGVSGPVALWVTSGTASPAAMGLFRRKIFLPEAGCKAEQLRFVVRHELVHLKRRDLWFQLLLCMARAVHWFNPLAWLLVRQARADMELTCDDAVLRGAEQAERRSYSETLLATLHRQRSGALTTHFYGGKELMKERFWNIMTGRSRRRGTAALCIALLLTAVALGAVACTAVRPEALSEEELAVWQEHVKNEEWYGFFAECYSDPSHLSLDNIFSYGAGIAQEITDPAERAEALALMNEDPDSDAVVLRLDREEMDAFLREKTGLGLEDFQAQIAASVWLTPSSDGTGFYLIQKGYDVNYLGSDPLVVSGERFGDKVTLTLDLTDSGYYGHGAGLETVYLTLEKDQVVSYTNEIYTAVEAVAEEHFQQTLTALADQGLTVEQAVMEQPFLRGWSESGYVQWELGENILLQKPPEDLLDDYPYGSWPRWIQGTEDYLLTEGTTLLDTGPYFGNPDAYVRYGLEDRMTFQPELRWPWDMETVLADCLASGDHWIEDRDEAARRYTEALGEEAVSMTVLEDDLTGDGAPSGAIALMEIGTDGGRTFRLLLSQCSADVYGTEYAGMQCWQVEAFQTEDGSLLLPEGSTLLVEQAEAVDLLEAGTYLALRGGSAYRLESFAAAYVAAMEQSLPAIYPDYTFGTPAITGFTWAGRSVTRDGRTIEKILVEWEIPVSPPAEESVWGEMGPDQVTEETWQFTDSTILLVEHTDSSVLRTYVGTDRWEFSYDRNFWQQAEGILDAMSVPLEVSPAIFYDWETEELFAVSTHPAEMGS